MDDQAVDLLRSRHAFFIGRPTVYILILLCACVSIFSLQIFSLQTSG
jgi:hypothetical protein